MHVCIRVSDYLLASIECLYISIHRSGAKKPPTPLSFDSNDPEHLSFVISSANMRAVVYNLDSQATLNLSNVKLSNDEISYIRSIVDRVPVPSFRSIEHVTYLPNCV